ncbi:hypothetical protein [Kribbella jiaozuonensis]|uniref:Uncharacterized protein n=1 Tax=Kribbella jiaozuonensis TaxID=2575441 RepID=A0A4U3M1V3_9ACTN|nr:hypothetical protein [Kribbella jiaozuonensis]TKK82591.1 hypothetical protein FDA38_07380 [Kribbella jiaozuonensis]
MDKDAIWEVVDELKQPYSPKSMENHRGLPSAVLGRAIEKEPLRTNPAKGIRLPTVTSTRTPKTTTRRC